MKTIIYLLFIIFPIISIAQSKKVIIKNSKIAVYNTENCDIPLPDSIIGTYFNKYSYYNNLWQIDTSWTKGAVVLNTNNQDSINLIYNYLIITNTSGMSNNQIKINFIKYREEQDKNKPRP